MISSQKLPWISNVDIVSASRALDTAYTNRTGKTMFVIVTLVHDVTAINDVSQGNAYVSGFSVAVSMLNNNHGVATKIQEEHPLVFTVPPGAIYSVNKFVIGTGTLSFWSWTESY